MQFLNYCAKIKIIFIIHILACDRLILSLGNGSLDWTLVYFNWHNVF